MHTELNYNDINLPQDVSAILEQDFWMLENIGPEMINTVTQPVKFSATTWIIVTAGSCRADINLVTHEVKAPALVTVKNTQILQPHDISPDFNASVLVMSRKFSDNLYLFMKETDINAMAMRHAVVAIPEELLPKFNEFLSSLGEIVSDISNPYVSLALLYRVLGFIYKDAYKCYEPYHDEVLSKQGRMSDRFLRLVQENFKSERFLDFYASKMEITPKHLSRTIKKQTGFTAVEWIERYVILEAKVLLKSSNLNIQQIADELNFPSQSFFGKYFKKLTGMSPKEFRNS
ncbi:MAG: AraC family transcriptional regulator [Candidatus Amulumruptor caecigallinarius]|nr:AraC family transcriptional regulator [Candidatus Amulumruptor caecigallinarius]